MENRFKVYLDRFPEIRSMIVQDIDIPEDPPERIQLYTTERGSWNFEDAFDGEVFDSLHDECEKRARGLDVVRGWIERQTEGTNQEKHFKSLKDIQNDSGIDFTERKRQMKQEWESFTLTSQHLFNYMQIFEFYEKILNKKLAEYRRETYAV